MTFFALPFDALKHSDKASAAALQPKMGQLKRLQPATDASVLSEDLQTYDLKTVRFAPATRQLYIFPVQTNMTCVTCAEGRPVWLAGS